MECTDFMVCIENHANDHKKNNKLLVAAEDGELKIDQVEKYLNNLMYFFHHTPIHLKMALNVALKLDQKKLVEFFNEKLTEEDGHDKWPQNDLEKLGFKRSEFADKTKIVTGTNQLLELARSLISKNPALFIPYMLYTEYVSILITPKFLDDLEKKCKIPKDAMTALGWHYNLDKKHVKDNIKILNIVKDFCSDNEMLNALNSTHKFTSLFTNQIMV